MISEYFSDEELINQLHMFFDEEEREHIDFESYLGQLNEINSDTMEVIIKNRTFRFNKLTCDVEEVL